MYYSCCGHDVIDLSADDDTEAAYQRYIDDLLGRIHEDGAAPDADPILTRHYGQNLDKAVQEGYGGAPSAFNYDTPDYATITALQNNVWQFAAAKTHTQLRQYGQALVGPDGKIRSLKDFRVAGAQITGKFGKYDAPEYHMAIAGAQMAAKWENIQAQKHLFPLLQFVAVMDSHTTDICRNLNGIVLPVDHPFWKKWYPPNHWGERATVKQLKSGDITPDDKIVYPDPDKIPEMFMVNLGERGLIFPAGHPYYTDVPPHVINNATLYMPVNEQYVIKYKAADGTELAVHRKTDMAGKDDLERLIEIGKQLVDRGHTVDILPEIHASETSLRRALLPDVEPGKNPDLLVDENYTEVKSPQLPPSDRQIDSNIAKAAKQADYVIIRVDVIDESYLRDIAFRKFDKIENLQSVTYVTPDGEFKQFLRNDKGR